LAGNLFKAPINNVAPDQPGRSFENLDSGSWLLSEYPQLVIDDDHAIWSLNHLLEFEPEPGEAFKDEAISLADLSLPVKLSI